MARATCVTMKLSMPMTLHDVEADLGKCYPDECCTNDLHKDNDSPQQSNAIPWSSVNAGKAPIPRIEYPNDCEAPVPTAKLVEEAKMFGAAILFVLGISISVTFLSYGIVRGKFGTAPVYEIALACAASACLGYGLQVMLDTMSASEAL
jgi:hypothetical protein